MDEIRKFAKFKLIREFVGASLIETKSSDLVQKLIGSKPIFIYNAVKLSKSSPLKKNYLGALYTKTRSLIANKKESFRIECFNINSRGKYSAKDIEVYIGTRLEKSGFNVSMKEYDTLAYLVIIDNKLYYGSAKTKQMLAQYLNPLRHYSSPKGKEISRSELKLAEAFSEFEIQTEKNGVALDLGAAPGGWSGILAKKGYKVIAIDPGLLENSKLKKLGLKIKTIKGRYDFRRIDREKADILYIGKKFGDSIKALKGLSGVSLLANDMNMHPQDSANAVMCFSRFMGRNAKLIMTVKCPTRNVETYIRIAKKGIAKEFKINRIKAMPNNRQEVTLYAIKKR